MGTIGEPSLDFSETLAAALDRAQHLIDGFKEARKDRTDCEKDVKRLAKEHSDAAKELLEAEKGLDVWREEWRKAVLPLNLPDEIGVDEATAVVDRLDSLFSRIKSGAEKNARVAEMNLYMTRFASDATSLIADLEPRLCDLPPEQALVRLQTSLTSAQEEAATRKSLNSQIEREEKVFDRYSREIKKADGELADLMAKAGCAEPGGFGGRGGSVPREP